MLIRSPCLHTDHQKRWTIYAITDSRPPHPKSQNESASETGTEIKSVEAEMEHTQQKGLRRGMEWEAYKTVRLTEKRKKNNSGR